MSPPTATDNIPASEPAAKEVQKGAPKFKFPKVSFFCIAISSRDNVLMNVFHTPRPSDVIDAPAACHLRHARR